jgi:hypothetical protein
MAQNSNPAYFLVAVSTRENLDLCIKYGLAGFPSSEGGSWTYCEIREGDFISFLYGARAHNLYKVVKKEAIRNAEQLPPWKPLKFEETGNLYSFPFRLQLEQIRSFVESIVKAEFFYVAENLLLRGGYRKTHFQADQTTLQSVSEMGVIQPVAPLSLDLPQYGTFTLRFTQSKEQVERPEIFRFQETILQSALRRHLSVEANLNLLLSKLPDLDLKAESLEVLGEKALTQGHVDLLLKERTPKGLSNKIPIEVKTKGARAEDVLQVRGYMEELLGESPTGILIAADFGKKTVEIAAKSKVNLVQYKLKANLKTAVTFEEIYDGLSLEVIAHV